MRGMYWRVKYMYADRGDGIHSTFSSSPLCHIDLARINWGFESYRRPFIPITYYLIYYSLWILLLLHTSYHALFL